MIFSVICTMNKVERKFREIFLKRHTLSSAKSVRAYLSVHSKSDYHVIEAHRTTKVISNNFWMETQNVPVSCELPDLYWCRIQSARIIGGSDAVITSDNILLSDLLPKSDEYNINYTDSGLLQLFGGPHRIFGKYITSYNKGEINYETGISLISNMSDNYFHFMFQVASRLACIGRTEIDKKIPLLVDSRVLKVPQMKQIINILNVDKRGIISIPAGRSYIVSNLYMISCPNIVVPNLRNVFQTEMQINVYAYDKEVLEMIKKSVLSQEEKFHPQKTQSKRIFISRRNCSKRRINEEQLKPILDKYNFMFVYPDEMKVEEQARMFNSAEHIISASGAALTNLIFCSPQCKILILLSDHYVATCFSSLAICLGINTDFIAGDGGLKYLHVSNYNISPEEMARYLDSIYDY